MQRHVDLADLVTSFPPHIFLQNLASIQKRTSPVKIAHLAEKSGKGSKSNLSTKGSAANAIQAANAMKDNAPLQGVQVLLSWNAYIRSPSVKTNDGSCFGTSHT